MLFLMSRHVSRQDVQQWFASRITGAPPDLMAPMHQHQPAWSGLVDAASMAASHGAYGILCPQCAGPSRTVNTQRTQLELVIHHGRIMSIYMSIAACPYAIKTNLHTNSLLFGDAETKLTTVLDASRAFSWHAFTDGSADWNACKQSGLSHRPAAAAAAPCHVLVHRSDGSNMFQLRPRDRARRLSMALPQTLSGQSAVANRLAHIPNEGEDGDRNVEQARCPSRRVLPSKLWYKF